MYTLFIDTHGSKVVLALYKDGKILDHIEDTSPSKHSEITMPNLKKILDQNAINVHDIGEIIVVNGPGSFTGVRLGVTIAKTLAYTLDIPIKTITTLEMYAVSANKDGQKLVAIKDVKGYFAGLYNEDNELVNDIFYKDNIDFLNYVAQNKYEDILNMEENYDFNKIYEHMKKVEPTIAHRVNPLYVKVIEALK